MKTRIGTLEIPIRVIRANPRLEILRFEWDLGVLQDTELVPGYFLEELGIVEHLDESIHSGITWLLGDPDGEVDERSDVLIDPVEQCPATCKDHAAVVDVGMDVRRASET